jgi:hypothetical protein
MPQVLRRSHDAARPPAALNTASLGRLHLACFGTCCDVGAPYLTCLVAAAAIPAPRHTRGLPAFAPRQWHMPSAICQLSPPRVSRLSFSREAMPESAETRAEVQRPKRAGRFRCSRRFADLLSKTTSGCPSPAVRECFRRPSILAQAAIWRLRRREGPRLASQERPCRLSAPGHVRPLRSLDLHERLPARRTSSPRKLGGLQTLRFTRTQSCSHFSPLRARN